MRVCQLEIENFRGIRSGSIKLGARAVLIGDNNTGKSSVLEAIDLVLGPDRLKRRPPVDEHDFHGGKYLRGEEPATAAPPDVEAIEAAPAAGNAAPSAEQAANDLDPQIVITATVAHLTEEQRARFKDFIEWWNEDTQTLYEAANVEGIDAASMTPALRVTFIGKYNREEDDFEGDTFFSRSMTESDTPVRFRSSDKRICGFLYLRSLRTGSRALSLEHGSLLDIILRLKEIRPQMWESTIGQLAAFDVASDPELGISGILESINKSLKKYVPREWGAQPRLKVSMLTREHLRKVVTAFIATGEGPHSAPYFRQGTGTINMLVLAMLSQIAEDKQNVIFAMEEPETAIPPYAQKRIVDEVRTLSAQAIFTSHSPYVLEEFGLDETVVLARDNQGVLTRCSIALPDSVKHKRYRQEFRTRFCEGLLARRVLLAEGATEAAAIPAVARRLAELNPASYKSLEALGICTVDAGTESQIADLGTFYRSLNKVVLAICDHQTPEAQANIEAHVDTLFMHAEAGFEALVLKNTPQPAKDRFIASLAWPPHLTAKYPNPAADADNALMDYFAWSKGNWGISDFLIQCTEAEIPQWIRDTCSALRQLCDPPPPPPQPMPEQGAAAAV